VSRRIWLAGLFTAACARHREAGELSIAAAADLQFAMEEIAHDFRGARLAVAYGSSGNFFSQIQNHAPFDVFLSADSAYPRRLAEKGIGVRQSVFVYAIGRLAVWVPAASALDPAHALDSDAVQHIAIANPDHAPYGRAAEAALRSLGLFDRVQKKLVRGESVSQAFEFVESGAAEAGIVALSLAVAPPVRGKGKYWEIPADHYPTMEQGGIIVKDSAAARAFRDWMLSPAAAAVLRSYGFAVPER
jgi:molybdate transport system substrate-binding protein